jgi:hypothetical protein
MKKTVQNVVESVTFEEKGITLSAKITNGTVASFNLYTGFSTLVPLTALSKRQAIVVVDLFSALSKTLNELS